MRKENGTQFPLCDMGGKSCGVNGENCYLAHVVKEQSHRGGFAKGPPGSGIGSLWRRATWDRLVNNAIELGQYCLKGRRYVGRVGASVTGWKARKKEFF